jgi:subtilisin-like proprotein convertase family protein
MRWRCLIWPLLGLFLLAVLLRLGTSAPAPKPQNRLLAILDRVPNAEDRSTTPDQGVDARFPHRLSNTRLSVAELGRLETALLLENAFLDTRRSLELAIPQKLRAQADPGTYIVQSRVGLGDALRRLLEQAGAQAVSYIPNNAYLVRASADSARWLARQAQVQAVLPYEPYYKLKEPLLTQVLAAEDQREQGQAPGKEGSKEHASEAPALLHVLLFSDARENAISSLKQLPVQIVRETSSPFGPVLEVRAATESLTGLAALQGVQELELASVRAPANDLTRSALGVATDSTTASNYLGLTGKGVVVNVNDSGVDTNQVELAGRVAFDVPESGTDTNGHGTHVAGIIAGSGSRSTTVANVPGSVLPPASTEFRGLAPAAGIYSVSVDLENGPRGDDSWLQQTAARTNAFISNNSWLYSGVYSYDLAAASYDAAVRDALPGVTGAQPLLIVFAAGNKGAGLDDGMGGVAGSIESPGTAKNVITVGAIEHPRFISNQTWTCSGGGGTGCQTNTPWLGMTDASNQVPRFSSRGNVGVGTEGSSGRFKPDVVAPGTYIVSTRSSEWDQGDYYSQSNNLFCPVPDANCAEVLSNLNNGLGPFYRFESGTSLAAASVSGTLALMQEFFEQRLGRTNSPALMKALLINGARSLSAGYNFQAQTKTNFQGWGLINLPNSLPASLTNSAPFGNSMLFFDQDPALSLVTGQSRTWFVSTSLSAQSHPLRVTLAWTDPPGNPVAGIKLVNDLDLIVTNLDTGAVFFGNDFGTSSDFTTAWDGISRPNSDFVNNVENVYIAPSLGANYSITVFGRRVNVNAVTVDPRNTTQDYALVVSSGDGQISDALTLTGSSVTSSSTGTITWITNGYALDSGAFGNVLMNQRIGASAPLGATSTILLSNIPGAVMTIGVTNQWQFYVFTNQASFSNVAFLTFSALPLSVLPGADKVAREADIDLYVSANRALTNLDPAALAAADVSASRGGNEMVVYTNASPAAYYIGVKCESQEGAQFGFAAVAQATPFNRTDASGNNLLYGFPAPAFVPEGTPSNPGLVDIFGISSRSAPVRRVIVTNVVTASSFGDLRGILAHGDGLVVLNNFATNGAVSQQAFIYDDSEEGDIPGAQPSDGPGSLWEFAGGQGYGQWHLTLVDTNRPATNESLSIFLEQQQDLSSGISPMIASGVCRQDYINIPLSATNLTGIVSFVSGTGPLSMQVYRKGEDPTNAITIFLSVVSTNATIVIDPTSHPPLNPGTYIIRICNLGPDTAQVSLAATPAFDVGPPEPTVFTADVNTVIPDDAVSSSVIEVTNREQVLSVEVGVRIDHPRVSDLALSLVGPDGTTVLLAENRGGTSPEGMGGSAIITNTFPVSYRGGPESVTNVIDTQETSGLISIGYDFYTLPDRMHVYYDGQLLFDSGLISGAGSTNLSYGPGSSTDFTIVMNEGGNENSNTAWFYNVTSAQLQPVRVTFTEDTNLASLPIKFAATPLTNFNFLGSSYRAGNGIYFLAEESLARFGGKSACGAWRLEILDRRSGATLPQPTLLSWQLGLRFLNTIPLPIGVSPSAPVTNIVGAGQIQWFAIDAPDWISFATNLLLAPSTPVNLLFNQTAPPTGTNMGDFMLLANAASGSALLRTNGSPPLVPGKRYYLGVQNTNAFGVGFALQVDFDIENLITLPSGGAYSTTNDGPVQAIDYYRFVASTNAVRVQFEINGPSANLALVARQGVPLPSLSSFDYISANPWTNDQLIVVYDYSKPVSLTPGEWFLGVVNMTGVPTGYTIMATEFTAYGTNIVITGVMLTSSNACLSWTSLPGAHYYIEGKASFSETNWISLSPTLTANDVITSYCVGLPSQMGFFRVREGLVITPAPLLISDIVWSPNGVLLQWSASTNSQFMVQWSRMITPPSWTGFTNRISSTTGIFSFLDDGSQAGGLRSPRYYRLRQLP